MMNLLWVSQRLSIELIHHKQRDMLGLPRQ
jgi:hypothetical protein